MAKPRRADFREYLIAAPIPAYGWPELDASRFRTIRPSVWIAAGGLILGLVIGFLAAWPATTWVYPGTQTTAWMGTPAQVLQGAGGQPAALQTTGGLYSIRPATDLQNPRNPQVSGFTASQPGYLDQVPGKYLQGTQNIAAK